MNAGEEADDQPLWSQAYSDSDLDELAKAAKTRHGRVEQIRPKLEELRYWLDGAAWNYRKGREYEKKIRPAELIEKFGRIGNYSKKILCILNMREFALALEGFRDEEEGDKEGDVEAVREDLERLARWCSTAKKSADDFRKQTTQRGHRGDDVLNDWVAAILGIYTKVTGRKKAGVSHQELGPDFQSVAGGPTIRFLIVAAKAIDHEATRNQWASHVKTVRKGKSE